MYHHSGLVGREMIGPARGIGIRYDREEGKDKDRSRFPEGMAERKARAKRKLILTRPQKRGGMGTRRFLLGGETSDVGGSSMLVSPQSIFIEKQLAGGFI